jgi:hypothetical protein
MPNHMSNQITRNNHYVAQWYQRGFLQRGQTMLHVLDLLPESHTFPDGGARDAPDLSRGSPKRLFCEFDLYTTRFGETLNDDVEKYLFGTIDKSGAEAIRALIDNDPARIHNYFRALFDYLDTQRLRTPKGLDWILSRYRNLSQVDLMVEMQSLRDLHCTMWTECVREIVSAKNSSVKFLVTDHPVTIYHRELQPDATECRYPEDPGIEKIGSQTVFALDANHCLILTNLEYAQSPTSVDVMAQRTHARFRAQSLTRTDAFIRKRELVTADVIAINHVLKSRARRYVAAGDADWLTPELHNKHDWKQIAEVLLPRDDLWKFGGDIFVGYKDGTTHYQDSFGRTSKAHEYLSKKAPATEPRLTDRCPCGSGKSYGQCCADTPIHQRPSWSSYSVRERNLMLCNAVRDVLDLDNGKDWSDVQRELSDRQVQRIHEIFESLWPQDTLLREILPRPKDGVLRALFMGNLDPRTLPVVATGWLDYFDEIVLANPFINAANVKPEYSPTKSPAKFKDQTLRNVLMLLQLEPYIRSGRVHLVPDPADLDSIFRREVWDIAKRKVGNIELSAEDKRVIDALARDDGKRWFLRGSDADLAEFFRDRMPDTPSDVMDKGIALLKSQLNDDPLALLQPIEPGEESAQLLTFKGFNRETGIYLASLTGSIIYCQMDAVWNLLHMPDGERKFAPKVDWSEVTSELEKVPFDLQIAHRESGKAAMPRAESARNILKLLVSAAQSGHPADRQSLEEKIIETWPAFSAEESSQEHQSISVRLKASVPLGGFERNDVTRLILTYGFSAKAFTIPVALKIQFD